VRRVFDHESVPADEKIVSLFESIFSIIRGNCQDNHLTLYPELAALSRNKALHFSGYHGLDTPDVFAYDE